MREREQTGSLAAHLDALGVQGVGARVALGLMREPCSIPELVAATALSRRAIEALIDVLADGVEAVGVEAGDGRYVLRAETRESSAALTLPRDRLRRTEDPDERRALEQQVADAVARAPRPDTDLDHVSATAASVVERALWLRWRYHLTGARVAFIGDHDLTSIAVALACPSVAVSVVDVDERLLDFLAGELAATGVQHMVRYADLRDSLPDEIRSSADIFVTDPPYTPAGVSLFVAAGMESLRTHRTGRGHLAYGFGEELPTLGLKVQEAIQRLGVVVTEIVADLNRYDGAQAIGSASDWYVLQPTARTRSRSRAALRAATREERRIYTRGAQAEEAIGVACDDDVTDLRPAPASELYRRLLTCEGPASFLVRAQHPDVATSDARQGLDEDLCGLVDVATSTGPDAGSVLVTATPAQPVSPTGVARRWLLTHPNSTTRTAATDAVFKARRAGQRPVSKSEARAAIDGLGLPSPDARVGDLPRSELRSVLTQVVAALADDSS